MSINAAGVVDQGDHVATDLADILRMLSHFAVEVRYNQYCYGTAALSGYKTLEVISGNASAYVHVTAIKKWDICAGNALLRSLGGRQTTLLGNDIDYSATGSPLNTDGLLVTLSDHDKYLTALQPIFKAMQQDAARPKRDTNVDNKQS